MSYIEDNGYFIFDGIKSSDYGVWISGGGTFNAPKRRYKDYVVPGRNGTLTIDEGVFEEIEVTYPAFIARDFPANIEAFRNELMARSGYVRMTDSYHPDEYYLARYMDGLDADVAPGGVGAQFNLTFKRDPRRFLVSGETPMKYPPDNTSPNNLLPYPYRDTTKAVNGITFTDNGDRTITVSGTATALAEFSVVSSVSDAKLPAGQYVLGGAVGGCRIALLASGGGGYYQKALDSGDGASFKITEAESEYNYAVAIRVLKGESVNAIVTPSVFISAVNNATHYESGPQIKITPKPNMLVLPFYNNSKTENGITFTVNPNGSVSANGTATAGVSFVLKYDRTPLQPGKYALGGASGGCGVLFGITTSDSAFVQKAYNTIEGAEEVFTIHESESQKTTYASIWIDSGTTVNATVTPTLRPISGGMVTIGDQKVELKSVGEYVIIDSEMQSCYREYSNLNSQVTFTPNDFPVLNPGTTGIAYSDNIESVEITPNWYIV